MQIKIIKNHEIFNNFSNFNKILIFLWRIILWYEKIDREGLSLAQ
jgi:hypothetical protein